MQLGSISADRLCQDVACFLILFVFLVPFVDNRFFRDYVPLPANDVAGTVSSSSSFFFDKCFPPQFIRFYSFFHDFTFCIETVRYHLH